MTRFPSSKLLGYYRTPLRGKGFIRVIGHINYKTLHEDSALYT